ncbi:MAG TPA: hypothetical protein EYH06_04295 [Chromatiales bacterium]|nr:hypothetical protein [Thiotrichales bacterium]HIP67794.1 hypothetical protein [Chromatiales bacterium]
MNESGNEDEMKPMVKVLLASVIAIGIAAWFLLFALPVFFYAIPDGLAKLHIQQPQHATTHFPYSSTGESQ